MTNVKKYSLYYNQIRSVCIHLIYVDREKGQSGKYSNLNAYESCVTCVTKTMTTLAVHGTSLGINRNCKILK